MSVSSVMCCVRSGLCDELITRAEEFYPVCACVIVCEMEPSTVRRPGPDLGCCARKKKENEIVTVLYQLNFYSAVPIELLQRCTN